MSAGDARSSSSPRLTADEKTDEKAGDVSRATPPRTASLPGQRSGDVARSAMPRGRSTASLHASITDLELRFARNPQSDVYRDLAEAYMDAGRFMEAMVVSKKGIKAHPDSLSAKVLLAEVYARQLKFPRALQELDRLAAAFPDTADVFALRGKVRGLAGEEDGAVDDLKHALDLDPAQSEAAELLAERGIAYPKTAPPPVPAFDPLPKLPPMPPAEGDKTPPVSIVDAAPAQVRPMSITPVAPLVNPAPAAAPRHAEVPRTRFDPMPRAGSRAAPPPGQAVDAPFRVAPQRLEGEDELERMARQLAEQKPPRGKPRTTLLLIAILSLVTAGVGVERVLHKSKIEAIDVLTVQAAALFNRDVYGSYLDAAKHLEEVLERHDEEHGPSLARLAHTYAILLGEHGEADRQGELKQILERAEKLAPSAPHTVAAGTLARLYAGSDRDQSARNAVDFAESRLSPSEGVSQDRPPTAADLALGIAEMHLGTYEEATRRLRVVKEALHDSVRAKVAHGRAAFRARRLAAAHAGFQAALRSEPDHPGARAGLALTKLRRGDLNGAAEDLLKFDEVALARPKDISRKDAALAEFARSEVLRSAGDETKATGAYEQALRLDPQNPEFPFGLGRWMLQNYRAKEALDPLRQAVKQDPNRWSFLLELAEAEMRMNNYPEAEALIDQASAQAPDVVEVKLAKARLLRRLKRPESEDYIKGLLAKHPRHVREIHLELGRWYRAQGRLELAQNAFEQAIEGMERAPRLEQAEALLSYGKLMDDMNRPQWALNSYKKAADLGAIEGWYRASRALKRAGQRGEAKKACERYLRAGASLRYSESAKRLCDGL